ncbi:hypothetical protein RHMOL_Rhmol10G0223100 [Rhododendron molle]|uniref:Uncharacterized protein n=1 Tax=Rhododendron molle TaxID=49168 RepID=A0ACC0M547_RHOML|nr:hypothetical protein RHMOL_Rhmol10G0223100 [Rhododendron molle]
MVSCYKIMEEFEDGAAPMVMPDLNASAKALQNNTKFRAFFDGFGFTPAVRLEITKATISIVEVHHKSCMFAKGSILQQFEMSPTQLLSLMQTTEYHTPITVHCMSPTA